MTLLPEEVEICSRVQYGHVCGGRIWRPEFGKASCWKCGTDEPGVVYRRKDLGPDCHQYPGVRP